MSFDYDLCVIGAGSGGVRAARMSASYGAKVAIIEEYRIGGTCVIRGCVPKKLFVYASHYRDDFQDAAGFGWDISGSHFNWERLVLNTQSEISRLSGLYRQNLEVSGVDIFYSSARLLDRHRIQVKDKVLRAEYILIATGGQPFIPDIAGNEYAITSDDVFQLDELPGKIVIVGGGYIAVEFASIFNGLGVDTTVIYRGQKILRGFDEEVRDHLSDELLKKGIRIVCSLDIESIISTDCGYELRGKGGHCHVSDVILYATGRHPKTQGLGLDKMGISLGKSGEILVDVFSKTSVDNIYAVGDVTNRVNLTPIAIREGVAFAETVFNKNPQMVDHRLVPTAIFTNPSVGVIGMTEEQARQEYEIDIYKSHFRSLKHTLSRSTEKTFMKMIVDRKTDKLLGIHIIGAESAEMIQAFGIAVTMGATKADFDATIAVHPTVAEEMVTFKESTPKENI